MKEIPEKHGKTLEFPYGSGSGISVSGMLRSFKSCQEPSLNQPNSDRSWRSLPAAVFRHSHLGRVCHRKGSSHSGFSVISFTDFRNRPFCPDLPGLVRIRVKRVRIRAQPGSKGAGYGPIQALGGPGPLAQGYLDLSNTYPGSP